MAKINKIKAMLQSVLAQFARMSTDKGLLSFDGEELEVGMSVMLVDEEGNESVPEDGEYKNDEGVVYVIADGKVAEIREPEIEAPAEEPAEEEVSASKEKFNKIRAAFEESYEDKELKIADAIRAMGIEAWIIEAGDDFAVAEVWNEAEGDWNYRRFSVSWDEEGNPVIGESEEVKSEFVPVDAESPFEEPKAEEEFEDAVDPADDKDKKIADLESEVARLEVENGELQERIKELEAKLDEPAAEPAEEEFEKVTKFEATGDKKIDAIRRYFKK